MDIALLQQKFQQIGARVNIRNGPSLQLDVRNTRRGEVFDLEVPSNSELEVLDVKPGERHLLLMSRAPAYRPGTPDFKNKFLCGHDERHWFVAGVSFSASTVTTAKELLKPLGVREIQDRAGVKTKERNRRKNSTFIRQGEWFFLPEPDLKVDPMLILKNEPIQRGRSKPHICRELYRRGGTTVYVNRDNPNGLTEAEYSKLPRSEQFSGNWRLMSRNPTAFARGWVSHPDHTTITLCGWHRIQMSQEESTTKVAFLD